MREFVTAAFNEADADDETITTLHDGKEVTFLKPSTGQMTLIMGLMAGEVTPKQGAILIATFFEWCDDDTARYFESRLLNRRDTFDLFGDGGILEIMADLMEEWGARPTKSVPDSPSSRSRTGKPSTAPSRAKASTSSRSRSAAS